MITNLGFGCTGSPLLLMLLAAPALGLEWTGYSRAGLGMTAGGGSQLCLGAVRELGRLGNECDHYLESGLSEELAVSATQSWKTKVSLAYAGSGSEEDSSPTVKEIFAEGQGLVPGSAISGWAGQRFYQRHDIHHLDFFYWDTSNQGAGVDNISVGDSTLAVAWFQTYREEASTGSDGSPLVNLLDGRINDVQLSDVLSLDVGFVYARPSLNEAQRDTSSGFADGIMATAEVTWAIDGDSRNVSVLQWGDGGYAHALRYEGGGQWYALEHSGHDARGWRFINWGEWQVAPQWTVAHALWAAHYQRSDFDNAHWALSATTRPMYQLATHVRLYVEAGYFRADDGSWGQTEQAKATLAVAVAPTESYLSRPELRLFVSRFHDFVEDQRFASGAGATTIGAQMEVWW